MSVSRQLTVLVLGVLFVAPLLLVAGPSDELQIPENQIEFELYPEPTLVFNAVNTSNHLVEGSFSFELVDITEKNHDYEDSVFASANGNFKEEPGQTVEKISWPVKSLPSGELATLAAMRLRYSFTPKPGYGFTPVHGVVQFGKIFKSRFNLSMTGSAHSVPGAKYPIRARVDDPATGKPLANISVELELRMSECDRDSDEKTTKRTLTTDSSGYVVSTFQLDPATSCGEGEVTATATRAGFSDSASTRFTFPDTQLLRLSTDKPLYQPGQTMHVRVLAFGSNKHALAAAKLKLTIETNESRDEQFERRLTTSTFGIATAEWEIPRKADLGQYRIKAELLDKDGSSKTEMDDVVRVSRYELPTFTVKVKPDRTYYLRGQNASVEVSADYLFGKPVQQAKVRVVRQDDGEWDSKTGRWTADESQPVFGEFDGSGKFVASIDLQPDSTFEENYYSRFKDLDFAAYVTDPSTGRTEQRRFTLRVAVQPVHLYVAAATYEPSGEPRDIYITSAYPDGTPASVSGNLSFAGSSSTDAVARFQTNEYGLARVHLLKVPEEAITVRGNACYRGGSQRVVPLEIEAMDSKGLGGKYSYDLSLQDAKDTFTELTTDHTLYRPQEPMNVSVSSSTADGEFVVDILNSKGVLSSKVLPLHDGHGQTIIPYDPRFVGVLTIRAYSMETPHQTFEALRRVIYSQPDELQVAVEMPRTTFLPGAQVDTDIDVRTPQGARKSSALGVVVFDEAVAERLRTDQEFGDYGFSTDYYFDYCRYGAVAGIGLRDLLTLDTKKPFSESKQLLAEALLLSSPYALRDEDQGEEDGGLYAEYSLGYQLPQWMQQQFKAARGLLDSYYKNNSVYPPESEFEAVLKAGGFDFDQLRDPWGIPYRFHYSSDALESTISIYSNGPDKLPNTADDIEVQKFSWRYFVPIGNKITEAINDYFERTGNYIRDYARLREEMERKGVELDTLRDPWGHPYDFTFDIAGASYVVTVMSGGGVAAGNPCGEIVESSSYIRYFQREHEILVRALAEHYAKTGRFPKNDDELEPILAASGLTKDRLVDPWGRPYFFTFGERTQYGDRTDIDSFAVYPNQPVVRTRVTPVTQQVAYISMQSNGPPGPQRYSFEVTSFSRVLSEQSSKDAAPQTTPAQEPLAQGEGTISGTVTDPTGAVILNATVIASSEDSKKYKATTNSQGLYTLADLPSGYYEVRINATGFLESLVLKVPVRAGSITKLDAALRVATVTETVTVNASRGSTELMVSTETAETVQVVQKKPGPRGQETPLFTPRVRQNFTETLLWQPEVITDQRGHAHISFPMADNITRWNMSVIASTQDGQIGMAEKQLRSFQPFFIESDPPKALTQGDRISLPVVLRNYSEKPLQLQAEMSPEPWLSLLSNPKQRVSVPANGNASATFTFRADASTRNGKQRVSARNSVTGDAVEQLIAVHPDGQEVTFISAAVLAGSDNTLKVDVPSSAITGSADVELRLYPSLVAHVLEAMQGIGVRPAGCAEQITSTAYVNLIGLELLKKQGMIDGRAQAELVLAAKQSVQAAYEQIATWQHLDSGFGYWQRDPSDLALTAYVLRFLGAAREYVDVDPAVIGKARDFLLAKQGSNGAWSKWDPSKRRDVEDAQLTSEIARSLAVTIPGEKDADRKTVEASLKSAMGYLDLQAWRDAYVVGNYAIAAAILKDKEHIATARSTLAELAHNEGSSTYWNLETNATPFYGWGDAGRIETTALAVEALAMLSTDSGEDVKQQLRRGEQFLLTHKDRYSVWYSTHASEAAVEALASAIPAGNDKGESSKAVVVVNGQRSDVVDLPAANDVVGAIAVDLQKFLHAGTNVVQVLRPQNGTPMNAQAITTYYVPWQSSSATLGENIQRGDTRALRLSVHYDQTTTKLAQPIRCDVQVERIGFQGYGMMVVEVGLPPGADVDRQSLQDFGREYEVRPDRVIFYVWPQAGGTKFSFSFKPRYRINAHTLPSTLCDYYNPEANATVAPVLFSVQ